MLTRNATLASGFLGEHCTYARGTIHPRPEGLGFSLPLDPTAITAVTDYINSGADLERRKRSGEKIQASRYFKPWFDEFFYEHDREKAKKLLMKFFNANEQGIQLVNHTYYGVLTAYLNAISRPAQKPWA